eukprot:scaffold11638_cov236-Chaetoceros_neogracile.AAC.1
MSRSTKSKALADLRARRNGLSAISRTDEYEVKDEDVYEKVGESDYQELVQRRREREDFVVDDGKMVWDITMMARKTSTIPMIPMPIPRSSEMPLQH